MDQALAGVLPAALVSGAALAIAWRPWSTAQRAPAPATSWGAPVAIGLGYIAGHIGLHGWPPPPPGVGVKDRLVYLALAAVLLGLFEALRQRSSSVGRALLCLASPWFLLDFMREHHWVGLDQALWLAGLTAIGFVSVSACEVLAERQPGPLRPILWVLVATLASGALHFGGSASLAQLASAVAAPLGAVTVIAWRQRSLRLSAGGTTVTVTLYLGLIAAGHFAAELPGSSAALLCIALLGPLLGELRPLAMRPKLRIATMFAGGLVPATIALWLARAAVPENPYAGY